MDANLQEYRKWVQQNGSGGGSSLSRMVAEQQAEDAPTKKNKRFGGLGGFLIDTALPTALGIGGAVAGTFAAPGAGTFAGGAAGSGLGEFIKQKIQGEDTDLGAIGTQAALGGLFSGAGKAAKSGLEVGGKLLAKEAAEQGVQGAVREGAEGSAKGILGKLTGKVASTGQQLEAKSAGFGVGEKVAGGNALDTEASKRISQVLEREGVKWGQPATREAALSKRLGAYGKDIDKALTTANRKLNDVELDAIKNGYMDDLLNRGTVDRPALKEAENLLSNFDTQVKDVKDLVKFRRDIDKGLINWGRNPQGAVPGKEEAARAFRGVIRNETDNVVPELAELNGKYHDLSEAKEFLLKGAKNSGAQRGGLVERVLDSGPVQSAESATGRALQRLTGASTSATPTPLRIGGKTGLGARETLATLLGNGVQGATEVPEEAPGQLPIGTSVDQLALGGETAGLESGINDPFGPDALRQMALKDIQDTGGKNLDKIAKLDALFGSSSQKAAKPLSQGQQERADLIKALGNTEDIMGAGSINYGPIGARVEGFKSMFNAADPETLAYKNTISGLRAAITKARAGASLTEGELKMLQQYTPSDTDSEQVVRSKLAQLRNLYGNEAPVGGSQLEDILSQGAY